MTGEYDEEERYELKERISFGYVLLDRILATNKSFDHENTHMMNAGLISLYDNLYPYLSEDQKKPIDEKIVKLKKLTDKDEFTDEAHQLFRVLLLTMRDLKLLTKEIIVDTY